MNNEPKLLNLGDKITEKSNYGAPVILTVTRVTATQAICLRSNGNEQKFKREVSGDQVNEIAPPKWSTTYYTITKEADFIAVARASRLAFLKDFQYKQLTNDQLIKVVDLLKSFQQ